LDNLAYIGAAEDNTEVSTQIMSNVVFGRFMLPDMTEHACQVTDVTYEGANFVSELRPMVGISIVAYLEDIGRVEAISGAHTSQGFEIKFTATGARLERLKSRIDFLTKRQAGGADGRRHTRYEPIEKTSQITLPDGRVYQCEVLDISLSGAAIKTDVMPALGTYLMLGRMKGRVVRYVDQGIGIQFQKQLEAVNLQTLNKPV
jgi:PilZ domain